FPGSGSINIPSRCNLRPVIKSFSAIAIASRGLTIDCQTGDDGLNNALGFVGILHRDAIDSRCFSGVVIASLSEIRNPPPSLLPAPTPG
ncbi:MAG: hypothetical protein ABSF34_14650, partial [Verrucomicrobiota bacterium]